MVVNGYPAGPSPGFLLIVRVEIACRVERIRPLLQENHSNCHNRPTRPIVYIYHLLGYADNRTRNHRIGLLVIRYSYHYSYGNPARQLLIAAAIFLCGGREENAYRKKCVGQTWNKNTENRGNMTIHLLTMSITILRPRKSQQRTLSI